ncbi:MULTISPECIES: hypothetical protein [Phyllobacteriaceae]|jgi:hypothetical protein|uniref:Uncharacterized protein n=1 Tax=Mesorhizobium hungaricum TaxID=1566387 RepID=A0A1C2DEH2_9HYPH|nr:MULTISPECIES: hypothetical protein [Mesorhizobium]MBN9232763.1 hypothetical protein [Mesorhizobium sp.]MDQ0330362.1 hypothetical protein [Mesorhizobium sp. YL-MeA3-2017]OCX13140.1 hypothetical protein QV13_26795 [Mesorhizobium hungaricum]
MPALGSDRDTKQRSGEIRELPVKGATVLYAGAMAAVNAAGLVVPMATALGLRGLGRVERRADNSAGADGALRARVGAGVYRFANSAAADQITAADIGNDCYGVDDQTVAKTNGANTRSVAGKIYDVDAQGVWVKFS